MSEIRTLLILIPGTAAGSHAVDGRAGQAGAARAEPLAGGPGHRRRCGPACSWCSPSGRAAQPAAEQDRVKASVGVGDKEVYPLWTWAGVEEAYRLERVEVVGATAGLSSSVSRTAGQAGSGTPQNCNFHIDVVLRADPLTAVMLATVTFISLLVAVYSIGYMRGDPGYWRFFTYIGLFVFSMTMLVSVSNFVMLYVFWEAVGLCSYLLIGFWFQKPAAAAAGMKAFLVNRVGDFGFALGIFLLWTTYGTLDFHDPLGGSNGSRRHTRANDARAIRLFTPAGAWPRQYACCCCWGPAARAPVPFARLAS